jgi:hypothetical protein
VWGDGTRDSTIEDVIVGAIVLLDTRHQTMEEFFHCVAVGDVPVPMAEFGATTLRNLIH